MMVLEPGVGGKLEHIPSDETNAFSRQSRDPVITSNNGAKSSPDDADTKRQIEQHQNQTQQQQQQNQNQQQQKQTQKQQPVPEHKLGTARESNESPAYSEVIADASPVTDIARRQSQPPPHVDPTKSRCRDGNVNKQQIPTYAQVADLAQRNSDYNHPHNFKQSSRMNVPGGAPVQFPASQNVPQGQSSSYGNFSYFDNNNFIYHNNFNKYCNIPYSSSMNTPTPIGTREGPMMGANMLNTPSDNYERQSSCSVYSQPLFRTNSELPSSRATQSQNQIQQQQQPQQQQRQQQHVALQNGTQQKPMREQMLASQQQQLQQTQLARAQLFAQQQATQQEVQQLQATLQYSHSHTRHVTPTTLEAQKQRLQQLHIRLQQLGSEIQHHNALLAQQQQRHAQLLADLPSNSPAESHSSSSSSSSSSSTTPNFIPGFNANTNINININAPSASPATNNTCTPYVGTQRDFYQYPQPCYYFAPSNNNQIPPSQLSFGTPSQSQCAPQLNPPDMQDSVANTAGQQKRSLGNASQQLGGSGWGRSFSPTSGGGSSGSTRIKPSTSTPVQSKDQQFEEEQREEQLYAECPHPVQQQKQKQKQKQKQRQQQRQRQFQGCLPQLSETSYKQSRSLRPNLTEDQEGPGHEPNDDDDDDDDVDQTDIVDKDARQGNPKKRRAEDGGEIYSQSKREKSDPGWVEGQTNSASKGNKNTNSNNNTNSNSNNSSSSSSSSSSTLQTDSNKQIRETTVKSQHSGADINGGGSDGHSDDASLSDLMYGNHKLQKRPDQPHFWTMEEDRMLSDAVQEFGTTRWKEVASRIPNRTSTQCQQRWSKVLVPGLKKGAWSPSEDHQLMELGMAQLQAQTYNLTQVGKIRLDWKEIGRQIPRRTAKQCRARWVNNLDPRLKRSPWTLDEDTQVMKLYNRFGGRWATIANNLPGRSENAVKVRAMTLLRNQDGQ